MALSFAKDIRPLFRDSPDIDTMKDFGMDLSAYADVKAQAESIYERVLDGSMPCDETLAQRPHRALQEVDGRGHGAVGAGGPRAARLKILHRSIC